MNPILVATRSRDWERFLRRVTVIIKMYGLTSAKMRHALEHYNQIVQRYECNATLPITGVVLARNRKAIQKLSFRNLEFDVHGYTHVDISALPPGDIETQIGWALGVFTKNRLNPVGFRAPYLQWNQDTLRVIGERSFLYDSSRTVAWDVVDAGDFSPERVAAYEKVLELYGAQSAGQYLSVPRICDSGLVQLPYSLPDDEALVDRLQIRSPALIEKLWLNILTQAHRRGELFVVGLHPERIWTCDRALAGVLGKARNMGEAVWVATLKEIAEWWLAKTKTEVCITPDGENDLTVDISGPDGTTILARFLHINALTEPWDDRYQIVKMNKFTVNSIQKPLIGLSPACPKILAGFLRQQGYLVELSSKAEDYTIFLDMPVFNETDQLPLLNRIEGSAAPLLRLARWPNRARSALAVTGDIDALTIWDYGLRFLNR